MENSSKKNLIIQICICVGVILGLLVIDIVTKLVVHFHFNGVEGSNIVVIKDFFWIYLTYNRGALAGFLSNASFGRILLSILSILGTIVSTYYLVKNFTKINIWYRVALYMFIPGCTGNLIDRVGIYGTDGVIDFLKFRLFGVWDFPVFNFADMCLTISIVIFFIATIVVKDNSTKDEVEKILNDGDKND